MDENEDGDEIFDGEDENEDEWEYEWKILGGMP